MTIPISGLAHVGIRVHDLERSMRFYGLLGFEKTAGPMGPLPVAILTHRTAAPPLEINLVLNARAASTPNVLMDVPTKAPGITHVSLSCPDIAAAARALEAAGFTVNAGPTQFPDGSHSIFVRDPDGVVIELNQPAP